jgi:hypothetical protein
VASISIWLLDSGNRKIKIAREFTYSVGEVEEG